MVPPAGGCEMSRYNEQYPRGAISSRIWFKVYDDVAYRDLNLKPVKGGCGVFDNTLALFKVVGGFQSESVNYTSFAPLGSLLAWLPPSWPMLTAWPSVPLREPPCQP